MADSDQITAVLQALGSGDQKEIDRLMPLVYDEMREIASRYMSRQPSGHTLRSTALVNEAYLKLCSGADANWQGRSHFFAAGAQAMRRILVDHARSKQRDKRGGGLQRVELDDDLLGREQKQEDILALNEAITKLQDLDPRQASIVELRFFGGMTVQQVAEALGVSKRTVELEWKMARAWLRRELAAEDAP
ncbi:RNA polymerase sigma factor [Posidoniimonas polymericola]|uniref:RNA polymerase sigma factor n=1 Tax=Posidoniimonas polymericola TaxID=2528002 RepID=A0A5C5YM43_9BACT|nr:sigma-70 family RNA polymerase sigma factor [Posidoniimonas polymericola]TWT75877.1 RNA polymerase sigma factor [Posidoniimonas polymericola]